MTTSGRKAIQAENYEPPSSRWRPGFRFSPALLAGVLLLIGLALTIYFLLTSSTIQIRVVPTASEIHIDEFHIPVGERLIVRTGTLPVTVSAEGYREVTRNLEISNDGEADFQIQLELLPGNLQIDLQPAGIEASVYMENTLLGSAPGLIANVDAGTRLITVDAPLYRAHSETIEILGRNQTQNLVVELQPAFTSMELDSTPQGAAVLLDAEKLGVTPLSALVEEGNRELVFTLEGYKPATRLLKVEPTVPISQTIELEPNDAELIVASSPAGAAVTLDGDYIGQTPLRTEVAPGARELQLFLAGYRQKTESITLQSNQTTNLDLSMQVQTAPVQFSVQPADAEIYIEGSPAATGSSTLQLATKTLQIEVRKSGYQTFATELVPTTGAKQVISVRLLTLDEAEWATIPASYSAVNGYSLKLFRKPGTIQMGSPRRQAGRRANEFEYSVDLVRPFYAGLTEVTNEQFRQFDPNHSSGNFEGLTLDGKQQPVVGITWQQAALFCNWLSQQEGLDPFYTIERGFVSGQKPESNGYRLLTEAEWTWLATSGYASLPIYPWGQDESPNALFGNVADTSISDKIGFTLENYTDRYPASAPVASFPENPNGLFDMGGNVAEWVNDWYQASASSSQTITADFMGPSEGEFHVIRGASWSRGYLPQLRLAYRDYDAEGRNDVGFRIGRYAK